MSPSAIAATAATDVFEDDLNLSILGLGVQYADYHNGPEALETLAKRYYPESHPMTKVLSVNRFTGIARRSAVGTEDHPAVNRPTAPSIREINDIFMKDGVRMAVGASRRAIAEWGGSPTDITHMVSTTCTNSANPGYDHFVAKQLGLSRATQKVLLHGIGCSGGLAAIRTAANLALGASARRRPARVLVLACEISSLLVRSELDSIHENQEVRIGPCLFSDCASACILSNGIGDLEGETTSGAAREPVFDILGWQHDLIDDTANELGFDVDPLGWKVVLTPKVPTITSNATPDAFRALLASIPALHTSSKAPTATDFAWALHPGGSTILSGVQQAMGLAENHLLASFQVYMSHGNSSSATIMSVLDQLRRNAADEEAKCGGETNNGKPLDGKGVVAAAFGPGISLEMIMLRRGAAPIPSDESCNVANKLPGETSCANGVETNGSHANNGAEHGSPESKGIPVNLEMSSYINGAKPPITNGQTLPVTTETSQLIAEDVD